MAGEALAGAELAGAAGAELAGAELAGAAAVDVAGAAAGAAGAAEVDVAGAAGAAEADWAGAAGVLTALDVGEAAVDVATELLAGDGEHPAAALPATPTALPQMVTGALAPTVESLPLRTDPLGDAPEVDEVDGVDDGAASGAVAVDW